MNRRNKQWAKQYPEGREGRWIPWIPKETGSKLSSRVFFLLFPASSEITANWENRKQLTHCSGVGKEGQIFR
jgi:hypothetical protein